MTANETFLLRRRAGAATTRVILALVALAAVVTVIACTWPARRRSFAVFPTTGGNVTAMRAEPAPAAARQADQVEPELGPFGPIDSVDRPVPHGLAIGGPEDAVDLSTPAAAVYSLLTLIERCDRDQLGLCLAGDDPNVTGALYPRWVGPPIRLTDVVEGERAATVQWEATALTVFERDGQRWTPGQYVPFTSRLIYDDGVWKVTALMQ